MNAFEINQKVIVGNKTYTVIQIETNSETVRPNLFKDGYLHMVFMTLPKSNKIWSCNVLTNGKMTRVHSL